MFCVDGFTYARPNPNVDLPNLCNTNGVMIMHITDDIHLTSS